MDILSTAIEYRPYDVWKPFYEWNSEKLNNFYITWNIKDIDKSHLCTGIVNKIKMVEEDNLWTKMDFFFTKCLSLFEKENPKYFIFLDPDLLILNSSAEEIIFDYMEKHKIHLLMPWLRNEWSSPGHPFLDFRSDQICRQWGITSFIAIERTALMYYKKSFDFIKAYWSEIRLPSVLMQANFLVSINPFLDEKCFHCGDGTKEERKFKNLTDEEIQYGIKNNCLALHPIKTTEGIEKVSYYLGEKR
jgi:hypothetical protein